MQRYKHVIRTNYVPFDIDDVRMYQGQSVSAHAHTAIKIWKSRACVTPVSQSLADDEPVEERPTKLSTTSNISGRTVCYGAQLVTLYTIRVNRRDDDVDTASAFRPVLPRSDNYLTPGGKLQLPPIGNRTVNKLRSSNSFGDIASEAQRQNDKPRLRKSNALDHAPSSKAKDLRSLSIAVPPNSYDDVSHLVSPLPTHKQFRHTDSIQRYDDEVKS